MLQVALLLCGQEFIRRNRIFLVLLAMLWGGGGALIFTVGILESDYFPLNVFGWLLLCESLITLIASSGAAGAKRGVFLFKGGVTGSAALLILSGLSGSNLLLAIILGLICFLSGTLIIISAWIVRYPHWYKAITSGVFQLLFSVFLFQPYPTHHDGTVPQFIGMLMLSSAVNCILLSQRLRKLKPGITIFDVQTTDSANVSLSEDTEFLHLNSGAQSSPELRILVWTPEGSSERQTISRPVINRYIAAIDVGGVISTGHAALEMQDIYISLYPSVDIDRSPSEFFRTLKAVQENDVPGIFQKNYESEVAAWCSADRQVCFQTFNAISLRAFSARYRRQEIYNLTWRNCSSSVAYALESALDGVLHRKSGWHVLFSLFLRPELWIAAQLRRRATTMAWTPGLVLDYSRALHSLVHPVRLSWFRKTYPVSVQKNSKNAK